MLTYTSLTPGTSSSDPKTASRASSLNTPNSINTDWFTGLSRFHAVFRGRLS